MHWLSNTGLRVIAAYLSTVWRATANASYPSTTMGHLRRLRHGLRLWMARQLWQPLAQADELSLLGKLRLGRPQVIGMCFWPYICCHWEAKKRFSVLFEHYQILQRLAWLKMPLGVRWVWLRLDDVHPGLSIQFDRPTWLMREGEITLNLFVENHRVYTLSFSFGHQHEKEVVFVGGIQGRSIEGMRDLYSDLTKSLFGCRPRDFLIAVMQMVSKAAGIQAILTVSDDARIHNHAYFVSNKKTETVNYNEIWEDRGGSLGSDGFYILPTGLIVRSLDDIPAKKRAIYRRRYQLFESIQDHFLAVSKNNQPCEDMTQDEAL